MGNIDSRYLANVDSRFQDLIELAWSARHGAMAFGPVTVQQGQLLEILLCEATQYREAHAHAQQLRSQAEAETYELREMLRALQSAVWRIVSDVDADHIATTEGGDRTMLTDVEAEAVRVALIEGSGQGADGA